MYIHCDTLVSLWSTGTIRAKYNLVASPSMLHITMLCYTLAIKLFVVLSWVAH